jgi:hypothetical protein
MPYRVIDRQLIAAAGGTATLAMLDGCKGNRFRLAASHADGTSAPFKMELLYVAGGLIGPPAATAQIVCTGGEYYDFQPGVNQAVGLSNNLVNTLALSDGTDITLSILEGTC